MTCLRRSLVIALTLPLAAAVGVRLVDGQAPPRYPLTQQYQQFNAPAPPTTRGVQTQMPVGPGYGGYGPQGGAPAGSAPPSGGAFAPSAAAQYPPGQYAPAPQAGNPQTGGPPYPNSGPPDPRMANIPQRAAPPAPEVFAPTQPIARVGSHTIIAGDLLGPINQALEPFMDKIPPEELPRQRAMLMERMLPMVIETKMVFLDAISEMPEEQRPRVKQQLFDVYEKSQLPQMMKKAGVSTVQEFEAKLRSTGSSLYKSKQSFFEQVLAHQWVERSVNKDPQVTLDELREHYQQHIDEYSTEAKARWEQLTARYDKFANREAAFAAIVQMGNEVLGGAPFAAVAKQKSQGFTAAQGGFHDWTIKGSLVSAPLDKNLFTLPIGRLSQIIADEQGFHIIRVIERREAAVVPFKASLGIRKSRLTIGPNEHDPTETLVVVQVENESAADEAVEVTVYVRNVPVDHKKTVVPALGSSEVRFELTSVNPNNVTEEDFKVDFETQARIRTVLQQEKIDEQKLEYLKKLRDRTQVWTIFDDANAASPTPR